MKNEFDDTKVTVGEVVDNCLDAILKIEAAAIIVNLAIIGVKKLSKTIK